MLRSLGTGDLLTVVAVLLIVFSASRVGGWGERLGELVHPRRGRRASPPPSAPAAGAAPSAEPGARRPDA